MTFVCTTPRRGSSPSKKLAMHEAQNGKCPICGFLMDFSDKLVDEHMTALGLGGSNAPENRKLVHATCAYAKTFGADGDIAIIAKAKRQKIRHLGLNRPKGRPMPGSKASGIKKRMDGTVVSR